MQRKVKYSEVIGDLQDIPTDGPLNAHEFKIGGAKDENGLFHSYLLQDRQDERNLCPGVKYKTHPGAGIEIFNVSLDEILSQHHNHCRANVIENWSIELNNYQPELFTFKTALQVREKLMERLRIEDFTLMEALNLIDSPYAMQIGTQKYSDRDIKFILNTTGWRQSYDKAFAGVENELKKHIKTCDPIKVQNFYLKKTGFIPDATEMKIDGKDHLIELIDGVLSLAPGFRAATEINPEGKLGLGSYNGALYAQLQGYQFVHIGENACEKVIKMTEALWELENGETYAQLDEAHRAAVELTE